MDLILTEKPSVGRDFAKALGASSSREGYIEGTGVLITWTIGHALRPLYPQEYKPEWKKWSLDQLPMMPEPFKLRANESLLKQNAILKKLFKRSDISRVIIATDAGREGELIAREVLSAYPQRAPIFRFWSSEALSLEVIEQGLKSLRPWEEYAPMGLSGALRQKADWLVGMNFSRLATLKLGELFSVGRVQTAVLALITKRDQERKKFEKASYWECHSEFDFSGKRIQAVWFDVLKKERMSWIDDHSNALKLKAKIDGKAAKVSRFEEKKKTWYPYPLFSLTSLQRKANQAYGLSAKRTLDIAQSLYEKHKCLSYPRSDSEVLGESNISLAKSVIGKIRHDLSAFERSFDPRKLTPKNKKIFNNAKLTDHHAIIPLRAAPRNLGGDERKVFNLVRDRFLAVFSKNAEILEQKFLACCEKEFFRASGTEIVSPGFLLIEPRSISSSLESLEKGEEGKCVESKILEKETLPPAAYSEASLLYHMANPSGLVEDKELKKVFRGDPGLGTQATRAQIIETLLSRSYIERAKKQIVSTEKGRELISRMQKLETVSDLLSPEETAKWEISLNLIARGEDDGAHFLSDIKTFIQRGVAAWSEVEGLAKKPREGSYSKWTVVGKCPLCLKGAIKKFPATFGCDRWKEGCEFKFSRKIAGKALSDKAATTLLTKGKVGPLSGFKSKQGKSFQAKLLLRSSGQIEFDFAPRKFQAKKGSGKKKARTSSRGSASL